MAGNVRAGRGRLPADASDGRLFIWMPLLGGKLTSIQPPECTVEVRALVRAAVHSPKPILLRRLCDHTDRPEGAPGASGGGARRLGYAGRAVEPRRALLVGGRSRTPHHNGCCFDSRGHA